MTRQMKAILFLFSASDSLLLLGAIAKYITEASHGFLERVSGASMPNFQAGQYNKGVLQSSNMWWAGIKNKLGMCV